MIKQRRLLVEWAVILIIAITMVAVLATSGATKRLDDQLYDRLRVWHAPPVDARILIVAIDDDSLRELGAWPWRRVWHARLIDRLRSAGASAIAYDVLFVEPTADDVALGEAMRRGPPTFVPMLFRAPGPNGAAVEAVPPASAIAQGAAGWGHVDLKPDGDGLIRHIALAETADGGEGAQGAAPLPHLMELVYRNATGHPSPGFGGPAGASLLLPYTHAVGDFPTVSFASVVSGEVPDAFLRERIILVGATATGIGDRFPTPMSGGAAVPGVELQANLLNGMLAGRLIHTIAPRWLAILSVLPVGLVMLGFWRWTPGTALRCSIIAILTVVVTAILALVAGHWWLPPGPAIAGLLLVYPLWGWRRLQAISDYVDQELGRFRAEQDLAIPERPSRLPRDVIEAQTIRLASAIDRIRDIRRFASDTVQHLPDPLFVTDLPGRITLANGAGLRIAGGDPVGHNCADLLRDLSAKSPDYDADPGELALPDGRRFVVARAPLQHADGVQSGWILRLVDITTIREGEQAREEILQLLSHDMRSPQASIITLIDGPLGSGIAPDLAARITRHARRTMALADNFVQLARMQAVAFAPVEMALGDPLAEAADELWSQARKAGVAIATRGLEEPLFIAGEPAMLLRAFVNLIDNAVRFSPEGAVVDCAITRDAASGFALCRITDHGPGISPELREGLFGRFASGGNSGGSGAGRSSAGLGLAFVKAVVERHGGQIRCDSSAAGTCFTLALPLLPL